MGVQRLASSAPLGGAAALGGTLRRPRGHVRRPGQLHDAQVRQAVRGEEVEQAVAQASNKGLAYSQTRTCETSAPAPAATHGPASVRAAATHLHRQVVVQEVVRQSVQQAATELHVGQTA